MTEPAILKEASMSGSRFYVSRRQCFGALAGTIAFATALPAQQPQANIRSITRYYVKADRTGDFKSILKELQAVARKAGYNRGASWWESQTGPSELVRVIYFSKWSEIDSQQAALKEVAAEIAPLLARWDQCIDHTERIVDVVMPDLSLPMSGEAPAMLTNLRVLVKPERVDEYLALLKSDLLPAVQKSGMKTFLTSRTSFGGRATEFRSAIALKGWSDLDGASPIVTAMGGDAAYQKFLAKVRPLLVESEYTIYRHRADLDFVPAK
jgi:hypothetical protein